MRWLKKEHNLYSFSTFFQMAPSVHPVRVQRSTSEAIWRSRWGDEGHSESHEWPQFRRADSICELHKKYGRVGLLALKYKRAGMWFLSKWKTLFEFENMKFKHSWSGVCYIRWDAICPQSNQEMNIVKKDNEGHSDKAATYIVKERYFWH